MFDGFIREFQIYDTKILGASIILSNPYMYIYIYIHTCI